MKLGFIGAGFIARFQSVAISQVRGLEIAGILKRRGAEALAGFCREQRLGDAKIYGNIAELARNVDVIAIYVPNYCRVEVMEEIAAAVKAGAHLKGVIVDKPLARNMKEARRMVELAREAKLLTAYFENQIFMKAIRSQREQLLPVAQTMGPLTLTRSAEDFATGMITYRNPETGQIVKSQFTDSWMFEKQGLRLVMASYLSAERGKTIDLTDKKILAELDSYVPAIQQGKGAAQLLHAG
jgi:predicted dehydrogenase